LRIIADEIDVVDRDGGIIADKNCTAHARATAAATAADGIEVGQRRIADVQGAAQDQVARLAIAVNRATVAINVHGAAVLQGHLRVGQNREYESRTEEQRLCVFEPVIVAQFG